MPISHMLEDFNVAAEPEETSILMSDVAIEDQRLASFEQGYTAGWEDAIKAQATDQTRLNSKLSQNLQDVSFTYHEALAQMLRSIQPLLEALTDVVLPVVLQETLGTLIVEQLKDMARHQAEQPVELVVPVGVGAGLRHILAQEFSVPVMLREDTGFVAGQAQLRVGQTEQELDTAALLASIKTSVEAFHFTLQEERAHEHAN